MQIQRNQNIADEGIDLGLSLPQLLRERRVQILGKHRVIGFFVGLREIGVDEPKNHGRTERLDVLAKDREL